MRFDRGIVAGLLAVCVIGLMFVPGVAAAKPSRTQPAAEKHPDIRILAPEQFTVENGVRSGSGTVEDPYVISGWAVNNIEIKDTAQAVTITGNVINGTLRLNYIGGGITVTANKIRNLRVNENIPRTGDMTSGLIAGNTIDTVGQIRHWDGVFENNQVGTENMGARAINSDGFNGGIFRNNVVYGYWDARLHGHHHSSSFDETGHSHHHGDSTTEAGNGGMLEDHSQRYHRVYVYGNEIYSTSTWALRYYDQAHSANDRTNASETNEELNKPHVHHTQVLMMDNELHGAGLWVDIFNADDRNHLATTHGAVDVIDNVIDLRREGGTAWFRQPFGIHVAQARDVAVTISGNTVIGPNLKTGPLAFIEDIFDGDPVAIDLVDMDLAEIYIYKNNLTQWLVGVEAQRFTETVHWYIRGLKTENVTTRVRYNENDVPNGPERNP